MEFLYLLEKIRNPIFNKLMLAITTFGEETAFLVVALIIFWCVDKNRGYYVMVGGFFGNIVNQFLKILCRVPRPWILDENFTIVEEAREAASGYSFPSGHSQTAVGTFGSLAATEKNRVLRWIFYCSCLPGAVFQNVFRCSYTYGCTCWRRMRIGDDICVSLCKQRKIRPPCFGSFDCFCCCICCVC